MFCYVIGAYFALFYFLSARIGKDSLELQQDLNKNIDDFNRLLEKFNTVTARKNRSEKEMVKAQTMAARQQSLSRTFSQRHENYP